MNPKAKDPINLIITGVGGQGNILISRLIGETMIEEGYWVTVGETYGASQRGGSVASHVRISKESQYSPITPEGNAGIILGLEPVESLRMLAVYGSMETYVLTNTRAIHPMSVSTREAEYPSFEDIKQSISRISKKAWYIDASETAIDLGDPLLTNMVMAGALVGSGLLPLDRDKFEYRLQMSFQQNKLALNLKAFNVGVTKMVGQR